MKSFEVRRLQKGSQFFLAHLGPLLKDCYYYYFELGLTVV